MSGKNIINKYWKGKMMYKRIVAIILIFLCCGCISEVKKSYIVVTGNCDKEVLEINNPGYFAVERKCSNCETKVFLLVKKGEDVPIYVDCPICEKQCKYYSVE